ncbi:MAG TPA: methyltransferase domain-containing protein [Candidatus Woesearchaeota archaeon]|nr:methyltransferase domain-containing protein [Candidatus Woesearchaeota archaeon]
MKDQVLNFVMLYHKSGRFFLADKTKDFHSNYGMASAEKLSKAKPGETVETNKGIPLSVLQPTFYDFYTKIKRRAQIIPLKDAAAILASTLVGKEDVCIDAGSGSGALGIFLARYCKQVISFDIREDHQEIAIENAKQLGVDNIEFRSESIYEPEKIKIKGASLLVLDVPEPWKALESALKVLAHGGFLAVYTPTIIQNADFVNSILEDQRFLYIKTSSIMEQKWEVEGRKVRPKSWSISHSGFISLARKL